MYGSIVRKNLYSQQHVLALVECSIEDVADEDDLKFGFQINNADKSFQVCYDRRVKCS